MLHFDSDYMEGAHLAVLRLMEQTNLDQTPGYGTDDHCKHAADLVRKVCEAPDAAVYFGVGGTQANIMVLNQLIRPWEGVVTAETGHVNGHEAGGPEAAGMKLLFVPQTDGKISAEDLRERALTYQNDEAREHIMAPGVVYISFPTEYGTVYSRDELEKLRAVCDEFDMRLYIDGARMGYGLAARGGDVTLADIARVADAFYIGGTKCGALLGEAIVFTRPGSDSHFFTLMKKRAGVLAKGWLLGIQFEALLTDGLYLEICGHAVDQAQRIAEACRARGYELAIDSPTNQLFLVLDDDQRARMEEYATLGFWENLPDGRTVLRLACSWATRDEDVDEFISRL